VKVKSLKNQHGADMLRSIESIYSILPLCCCTPAVDVEDAIANIDFILKELKALPEQRSPDSIKLQKEQKKQQLEKAYEQALQALSRCCKRTPDKRLALRMGDILAQFGRLCYEENYATCKQILLASLNTQFYAIGLIDDCLDISAFHTLQDLKKQGATKPNLFKFMDDLILSSHQDRCLSLIWTSKESNLLPEERMFVLAYTLRWLGHCFQNLDTYKEPHPTNDRRFEQIYHLCEAILLLADNNQCREELAELYYNAWPFMHGRKYPNDAEGKCAIYDKCLAYNSEPEMRARVANMRFIILSGAGEKEKAAKYLKEAMAIREEMPESQQNGFLLANLRNNYAAHLMELNPPDLEEAEKYTRMAINYSAACRAHDEDNIYFAIYDSRLAKIMHLTGRNAEAMELIERAINTLKKYPESNHDLMEKTLAVKALITQSG
jgi:hypothetical protein